MNARERIAANIRALMARSGFAREAELSRASGVSPTHLNAILRQMKSPTPEILERIARALQVDTWQLLAPPELLEPDAHGKAARLLANYLRADPAGRSTIERVAETQADYHPVQKDR